MTFIDVLYERGFTPRGKRRWKPPLSPGDEIL
jgi:hypothetical protein